MTAKGHKLGIVQSFVLLSLRGYQRWVSPWLPLACRFHPTCSRYAYECFERYSLPRALYLSLRRLARCHPLHPGGRDPVPPVR